MKIFHYSALNAQGVYVKSKVEASSLTKATRQLERDGFLIVSLKPEKSGRFTNLDAWLSSVSRIDKIFFTNNLYTLLESGMALDAALRVTTEQSNNQKLKAILLDIHNHVQRGQPLWSALGRYPQHFSKFYINLVQVGETTGKLSDVLLYLLEQQEKDYELIVKARGAMIYPSIIMSTLFAMIIFMMTFVIPKVTQLLVDSQVALPLATSMLIAVSNFLIAWGAIAIPAFILLLWLLRQWIKQPKGQWYWDGFLLVLPKIKQIVIEFNLARFARAMSALLKSGVPIDRALELAASVTGNSRYQKSILAAVGFVQKGIPMTEVLKGYPKLYPPIANRMIEVGERTGRMDHMLGRLASFYEKSVTNTLVNISSVIEPVLLLFIGLAVGFVAIAILTPIWKFSQAI